jgi:hypothetical protein
MLRVWKWLHESGCPMRWRIVGLLALFIANGEAIADESSPPPALMVQGFKAALADPKAEVVAPLPEDRGDRRGASMATDGQSAMVKAEAARTTALLALLGTGVTAIASIAIAVWTQRNANPANPCSHLMELNRHLGIVSWAALIRSGTLCIGT